MSPVLAKTSEPARLNYFFGAAWRDWKEVAVSSWASIQGARGVYREMKTTAAPFRESAQAALFCFGVFWIALLGLAHGAVLAALAAATGLLALLLGSVEICRRTVCRLFSACPGCHQTCVLPHFVCPKCGVLHRRLFPNQFGCLFHRCKCGQRLPASFWNGRAALKALCPVCGESLDEAQARPVCVPLIGRPGSGKSEFLVRACQEVLRFVPANGGQAQIHPEDRSRYAALVSALAAGALPKTADRLPRALRMTLTPPKAKVAQQVYLYDPAGEVFAEVDGLAAHSFYQFASGYIMCIDLSKLSAATASGSETAEAPSEGSSEEAAWVAETVDRWRMALEKSGAIEPGQKATVPLAVILAKADQIRSHPPVEPKSDQGEDSRCRECLREMRAEVITHKLQQSFANVRYFFAGRSVGKGSAEPSGNGRRVSEPLLWILEQCKVRIR